MTDYDPDWFKFKRNDPWSNIPWDFEVEKEDKRNKRITFILAIILIGLACLVQNL